jgi:hypothetical protein
MISFLDISRHPSLHFGDLTPSDSKPTVLGAVSIASPRLWIPEVLRLKLTLSLGVNRVGILPKDRAQPLNRFK